MTNTTCPNHPDRPSTIESAYGFCVACAEQLGRQTRALERAQLVARSQRLADAARTARIADREGVVS